jgi:hypothetical protein
MKDVKNILKTVSMSMGDKVRIGFELIQVSYQMRGWLVRLGPQKGNIFNTVKCSMLNTSGSHMYT